MNRSLVLLWLLAIGCAGPSLRTSVELPRLTEKQVTILREQALPPEKLGVEVVGVKEGLAVRGGNALGIASTVTVPMVALPDGDENDPGSRYRLPVVLGSVIGKSSVQVLLDSGSNRHLMGYSLAQSLDAHLIAGLPAVTARGLGGKGSVDSYWGVVPGMDIGALQIRRLVTLVSPDAQVLVFTRSFWGETQVMVFGLNALSRLSYVSLDYLKGQVTFEPTAKYLPDVQAEFVTAVPMREENGLPVVEIVIEGRYRGPAVVDTGGNFGLLLSRQLATELEHWKEGWGTKSSSHGIAGEAKGKGYIVHRVRVGEANFSQVPAMTQIEGPEPLGGRVVLGNRELRRYRVTFDFQNKVLWLER